ncbi:hypothetical protein CTP10_R14200 [Cupriavidus sp. P-10]|uniref:hypothetical protein n=1 Tax=unclassified Cupriavidus TaxID=2640874 RepID=UPI000EC88C48|nr:MULTISPECIES: hypothetical protein [unclassified Cupriavidus]BDB24075.1 hypothetical protein CTP10_R14200 [Cupriavidus sp. P-10]
MNLETIERLAERMRSGTMELLELELGGKRLVLSGPVVAQDKTAIVSQAATQPQLRGCDEDFIRAPAAGIFHASHPLADETFEPARLVIEAGEPVGYLQVGAVLSAVLAGERLILGEQAADCGSLVGYGQALFAFERVL